MNGLLCLLQALHWFNPLLWFAFARMRADRETACDADVLSAEAEDRRGEYGHALLKLQAAAPSMALGLAFVGLFARAGIRARLCAIAAHRRSSPAWGVAGALMIAALTLVGATRADDSQNKAVWGTFVSYAEGTLTLKVAGGEVALKNIGEPIKVLAFDRPSRSMKPANPAEALGKAEPGAWIFVAPNRDYIRIGAAKEGHSTGTFVSYKEGRLLLLGKDLPVSNFTRKYGNNLHYPKFDDAFPVFESIDGGEYTLAGNPSTAFPKIAEGTLVTVYYGPNDGFFIRAEIGTKKQP